MRTLRDPRPTTHTSTISCRGPTGTSPPGHARRCLQRSCSRPDGPVPADPARARNAQHVPLRVRPAWRVLRPRTRTSRHLCKRYKTQIHRDTWGCLGGSVGEASAFGSGRILRCRDRVLPARRGSASPFPPPPPARSQMQLKTVEKDTRTRVCSSVTDSCATAADGRTDRRRHGPRSLEAVKSRRVRARDGARGHEAARSVGGRHVLGVAHTHAHTRTCARTRARAQSEAVGETRDGVRGRRSGTGARGAGVGRGGDENVPKTSPRRG